MSCLPYRHVVDLVKPNARDFGRKSKREVEMKDAQRISLSTTISTIPTHKTIEIRNMRDFDLIILKSTKQYVSNEVGRDARDASKRYFSRHCARAAAWKQAWQASIFHFVTSFLNIEICLEKHQPWLIQQIRRTAAGRGQISPPAFSTH
jgi:hypothetical protein